MCNCENVEGFKQSLSKAKALTDQTGENHVVYVHKAVEMPFVRKETDLTDDLNICCYFLPNGTEVEYTLKEIIKELTASAPTARKKGK